MKRVLLFVLPMLATLIVLGLGLFLFRSHALDGKPGEPAIPEDEVGEVVR